MDPIAKAKKKLKEWRERNIIDTLFWGGAFLMLLISIFGRNIFGEGVVWVVLGIYVPVSFLLFLKLLAPETKTGSKVENKTLECPQCHETVRLDKKTIYCPNCYEELQRNCPHCSELVTVRASKCPYCGEKLPEIQLQEN